MTPNSRDLALSFGISMPSAARPRFRSSPIAAALLGMRLTKRQFVERLQLLHEVAQEYERMAEKVCGRAQAS